MHSVLDTRYTIFALRNDNNEDKNLDIYIIAGK